MRRTWWLFQKLYSCMGLSRILSSWCRVTHWMQIGFLLCSLPLGGFSSSSTKLIIYLPCSKWSSSSYSGLLILIQTLRLNKEWIDLLLWSLILCIVSLSLWYNVVIPLGFNRCLMVLFFFLIFRNLSDLK